MKPVKIIVYSMVVCLLCAGLFGGGNIIYNETYVQSRSRLKSGDRYVWLSVALHLQSAPPGNYTEFFSVYASLKHVHLYNYFPSINICRDIHD